MGLCGNLAEYLHKRHKSDTDGFTTITGFFGVESLIADIFTPKNMSVIASTQPGPQAFPVRSNPTVSGDVTERASPTPSQTSRGQGGKRERLGTRLASTYFETCMSCSKIGGLGVDDVTCQTVTGSPKCCMKPLQSLFSLVTGAHITTGSRIRRSHNYRGSFRSFLVRSTDFRTKERLLAVYRFVENPPKISTEELINWA